MDPIKYLEWIVNIFKNFIDKNLLLSTVDISTKLNQEQRIGADHPSSEAARFTRKHKLISQFVLNVGYNSCPKHSLLGRKLYSNILSWPIKAVMQRMKLWTQPSFFLGIFRRGNRPGFAFKVY